MRPGYFPAEFVLELARFDYDSLQHFIFLERPEGEPIEDAKDFTIDKLLREVVCEAIHIERQRDIDCDPANGIEESRNDRLDIDLDR